jgi:hypothetical protein
MLGHIECERFAVLRVGLIEQGAGAGNGDSNAVSAIENLADPADIEANGSVFTGFHEDFFVEPIAIADSPRVIDEQYGATVGIDIADTNDDVRIGCCG